MLLIVLNNKRSLLQEVDVSNKQNDEGAQISCNVLDDVCNADILIVSSGKMSNDNGVDRDVAEHEEMETRL